MRTVPSPGAPTATSRHTASRPLSGEVGQSSSRNVLANTKPSLWCTIRPLTSSCSRCHPEMKQSLPAMRRKMEAPTREPVALLTSLTAAPNVVFVRT